MSLSVAVGRRDARFWNNGVAIVWVEDDVTTQVARFEQHPTVDGGWTCTARERQPADSVGKDVVVHYQRSAVGAVPGQCRVAPAAMRPSLAGLADLDGADRDVQFATPDEICVGEVVFGAPVRVMGRTVMEGMWTIPGSEHVGLALTQELKDVRHETDRLRRPERVLRAVFEIGTAGR